MSLNNTKWYNIAQVSEITGLSKQVIRKWEQRYELIKPERQENGHRVYHEEHIRILQEAQQLIEEGYSIKQAAALILTPPLIKRREVIAEEPSRHVASETVYFVDSLLREGEMCRDVEVNRLLAHAHQMLGLKLFLEEVVVPFLTKIGEAWHDSRWSEYQEAFCSMVVRDYLVQVRRNYEISPQAPLLLGACLPGEHHEIQLHILLLQAAIGGWRTVLVGSSPAVGAIESLVLTLQPQVVLLSAMTTKPFEIYPNLIKQLDMFACKQKNTKFYIGGAGTTRFLHVEDLKYIHMTNNLEEILTKA